MVLDTLGRIAQFRKPAEEINEAGVAVKKPQHVAITIEGVQTFCSASGNDLNDCYQKSFIMLKNLILFQVKSDIPIFTINILPENMDKESSAYSLLLEQFGEFLQDLIKDTCLH